MLYKFFFLVYSIRENFLTQKIMQKKFRVLDTGHMNAAQNMALDSAILEALHGGLCDQTIRFLSFRPHAVLVGCFQSVKNEVREDFCAANHIDINRRITGGGSLYWDEHDVGWEIYAKKEVFKKQSVEDYYALFCAAVAKGINAFGIRSGFRPRNDIEVGKKKISGSGGTSLGDAFLFQGTLLVDLDIDTMLRALRIPVEKLKYKEIDSLKQRITWLAKEIGYRPPRELIIENILAGLQKSLGLTYYFAGLNDAEKKIYKEKLKEFQSKKHIYRIKEKKSSYFFRSYQQTESGIMKCAASIDIKRAKIKTVYFSGDFFAYPQGVLNDLESFVKNISAKPAAVEEKVASFFHQYGSAIDGISIESITGLILAAVEKTRFKKKKIALKYANDLYFVNCSIEDKLKIDAFLIPYCAKGQDCKFRKRQGCALCGGCSVHDAVGTAKKYGLKKTTITSYEHLERTLKKLKAEGSAGFLGCCCEQFYLKHKEDFERIGMKGVLVNIDNKTCYDLGKEQMAYKGRFEGFTHIKNDLLTKVLQALNGA